MVDDKTIIAEPLGLTTFQGPKNKKSCFVQYSGQGLGRRYVLDRPEMTIGRSPENEIVINEQSVSRQHVRLVQMGESVEIFDMKTTNGTYINDKQVSSGVTLQDGDVLRLGTILLKFYAHNNIDSIFHDRIYRMATIDAGTQIFNRKYMMEALESEFKFSNTYGKPLSLIYFDLDFFKSVNDNYGHNVGDFILKECAELATKVIRKEDIFGRMGGEEFCVILPGTRIDRAAELAERIRSTTAKHSFSYETLKLTQTLSVGVAELESAMRLPTDLIEKADQRLYFCKKNGRNQVCFEDHT